MRAEKKEIFFVLHFFKYQKGVKGQEFKKKQKRKEIPREIISGSKQYPRLFFS